MSDIHLDHAVLSALREVMEDEFQVLLDTFLADSAERLRQLREAVARSDCQSLRLHAHSFKGSCSNMGAQVLAGLCKQLEDLAQREQLATAPGLVERIEGEFRVVRDLLRAEQSGGR